MICNLTRRHTTRNLESRHSTKHRICPPCRFTSFLQILTRFLGGSFPVVHIACLQHFSVQQRRTIGHRQTYKHYYRHHIRQHFLPVKILHTNGSSRRFSASLTETGCKVTAFFSIMQVFWQKNVKKNFRLRFPPVFHTLPFSIWSNRNVIPGASSRRNGRSGFRLGGILSVPTQKTSDLACFETKNAEKCTFLHFFCQNIWSCQKKAVPLQPLLKKQAMNLHRSHEAMNRLGSRLRRTVTGSRCV